MLNCIIQLVSMRANFAAVESKEESNLLIILAPLLEDFIAGLFNIRAEVSALQSRHNELGDLYTAKRLFVQRAAAKFSRADELPGLDGENLKEQLRLLMAEAFSEKTYAKHVIKWLDANDVEKLTIAARYANWASNSEAGKNCA